MEIFSIFYEREKECQMFPVLGNNYINDNTFRKGSEYMIMYTYKQGITAETWSKCYSKKTCIFQYNQVTKKPASEAGKRPGNMRT